MSSWKRRFFDEDNKTLLWVKLDKLNELYITIRPVVIPKRFWISTER